MNKKKYLREIKENNKKFDEDRYLESSYVIAIISGITIGALLCIAGFILLILGLNGSIDWVFEAKGIKSKIANASPGIFFALLGTLILWKYKPIIEKKRSHKVSQVPLGNTPEKTTVENKRSYKVVQPSLGDTPQKTAVVEKPSHKVAQEPLGDTSEKTTAKPVKAQKTESDICFHEEKTSVTRLASNQNLVPPERPSYIDTLDLLKKTKKQKGDNK